MGLQLTESLRSMRKTNLLLVFVLRLAFFLLPLMRETYAYTLYSNYVSQFFLPVRLAGLDWTNIGSNVLDSRQGHFVFFAPVFKLFNDPYTIHNVVLYTNIVLLTLLYVFVYVYAVTSLGFKDNAQTAIAVVLASYLFGVPYPVMYEATVHAIVWIACILLMQVCKTDNNKRCLILTTMLVCLLTYGLMVHTRLLVLTLSIGLIAAVYYVAARKWIVAPYVFYPGAAAGYLLAYWFNSYTLREFFGNATVAESHNATVGFSRLFTHDFNVMVFFDLIAGNTYKMIIMSYGVAAVSMALAVYLLYKVIKSARKGRVRSIDTGIPRGQLIVFCVFGCCVAATIVAIYLRYGAAVETGYEGNVNQYMRGLAYDTYYRVFFGPVFLAVTGMAYKRGKLLSGVSFASLCATAPLFVYFYFFVVPKVQGAQNVMRYFYLPSNGAVTSISQSMAIALLSILGFAVLKIGRAHV